MTNAIDWKLPVAMRFDHEGKEAAFIEWQVFIDGVRHIRELEFYSDGRIEETVYEGSRVVWMGEVWIVKGSQ